jgi:hypothetical protein
MSSRSPPEMPGKALAAHTKFLNAETPCKRAIRSAGKIEPTDETHWNYLKKQWSEILRPELERAFAACETAGMPADQLSELKHRMDVREKEWNLICEYRESIPPSHLSGKRGRPAEYNWSGVKKRLESYASENGPVRTLDELLQKVADFAHDLHPRKKTPSDKTIRDAIKTHALDKAAGFAPGK